MLEQRRAGRRNETSGHSQGWKAQSMSHPAAEGEKNWPGLMGTIKGEAGGGRGCSERYPFKRNISPARAAWEIILAFHFQDLAKEKALVVVSITEERYKTRALLLSKAGWFGQHSHTSTRKQSDRMKTMQFKHERSNDYVTVKNQDGKKQ